MSERICEHCKMNIDIRNPSGYCDHLYYPENCEICCIGLGFNPKLEKMDEEKVLKVIEETKIQGDFANLLFEEGKKRMTSIAYPFSRVIAMAICQRFGRQRVSVEEIEKITWVEIANVFPLDWRNKELKELAEAIVNYLEGKE